MAAETNGALAVALVAFQKDAPKIERTKSVTVTTKAGGSYKFAYAPLEAILAAIQPGLTENGLAVSQLLSSIEGRPALRTVLLHSSGDSLEAEFPLPIGGHESAQEIGSLISYMRRYSVVSLLGLATEEDDDGNHASGNTAKVTTKPAAKSEPRGGSYADKVPPGARQGDLATEPQRTLLRTLATKLHDADVINETAETTIKAAADDPKTTKAAASDAITKLKEKEAGMVAT